MTLKATVAIVHQADAQLGRLMLEQQQLRSLQLILKRLRVRGHVRGRGGKLDAPVAATA